jgi:aldehyde dehydrogenase (NAD+)
MEHPLAIYIFSTKQTVIDESEYIQVFPLQPINLSTVLNNTQSGGVTVNDVVMHAGVPNAPFGGIGESGYGAYHGQYGFLAFSHQRVVVSPPTWLDRMMSFRYPPYDMKNLSKLAVSNKLGFKKGETMKDQKVKNIGSRSYTFRPVIFGISALLIIIVARLCITWGLA